MIERIDRFISSIEKRKVEPDHWEGHCTKLAIADIGNGRVERAEAKIILARTPTELRVTCEPLDVLPNSRNPTIAELRAELERIKSQAPN
ncbi:MAG: hypothetical protein H7X89_16015 [Rhizobiales bacterium]|nr:hypothetical protein [Hyphomicrobiales bacterium]